MPQKFHDLKPLLDNRPPAMTYQAAFNTTIKELERDTSVPHSNKQMLFADLISEHLWFDYGKPYFKIWPAILPSMMNVNFCIEPELFAVPYPAFLIRLPTGTNPLREADSSPPVTAILVCDMNSQKTFRERTSLQATESALHVMFDLADGAHFSLKFPVTKNIDQRAWLNSTCDNHFHLDKKIPGPPVEFISAIISVVVATAMFGINRHELVMPEIERDIIDATKKYRKRFPLASRLPVPTKGWLIGSEMDLPSPIIRNCESCESLGRELTAGHIRRAHIRHQPCGPGSSERKLVFIQQTVIRPDLPMKTSHGYRIGRGKNPIA